MALAPIKVQPIADVPFCSPDPAVPLHEATSADPGLATTSTTWANCGRCHRWYPAGTSPRCWTP